MSDEKREEKGNAKGNGKGRGKEKDSTLPNMEIPSTLRNLLGTGTQQEDARDGEVRFEKGNEKDSNG